MVISSQVFGFAKQWLYSNNLSILRGDEQILKYENEGIDVNYVPPSISPGTKFTNEKIIKDIHDYETLVRNGLGVYSKRAPGKFFRVQNVLYVIERRNPFKQELTTLPTKHWVEWEKTTNSFRLRGKNAGHMGVGSWVCLNPKRLLNQSPNFSSPSVIVKNAEMTIDSWSPIKVKKVVRRKEIKELALLKCIEEGKIICIKETANEPVIGVTGERGKGKSFFLNRLKGCVFWQWHKKIADLNDMTREGAAYCIPWHHGSSFLKELKLLAENTVPLPAIYLTPQTKNVTNALYENEGIGFRISMAFEDLISSFDEVMQGTDMKLGKSQKYMEELKPQLLECDTIDQIHEVLEAEVAAERIHEKSAMAINATLKKIFKEDILDITNGIPSMWRVLRKDDDMDVIEDIEYPPMIAALYCDLAAIVQTGAIKDKKFFPQIFKYWADDIFRVQTEDPYFMKNKIQIWTFVDEITRIASKKYPTVASDTLQEFATTGRPKRIGLCYATQNYSQLFDTIRQNTQYVFAFKQKKKEGKQIGDDFDLSKFEVKDMINLKQFEMLACTTEKFITTLNYSFTNISNSPIT